MNALQSKPRLLWLQSITCNGNTHSFFNYAQFESLMGKFELIHHPVLETAYSLQEVLSLKVPCDVLILEGAFATSGFVKEGIEILEVATHYASKAKHIITLGTCATFGGVFAQSNKERIGGFCFDESREALHYKLFASKLISIPGCPIHPQWLAYVLDMLIINQSIALDELHRPRELFGYTVHNGCVRNEYFEWKIDSKNFGEKEGCLYYEQGCQGPHTRGSCNKILWNEVSSKTRAGTPCFGCTEPSFPKQALFKTKTNMGIPATVPLGIPKRAYLTLSGVAKGIQIKRFSQKLTQYDEN